MVDLLSSHTIARLQAEITRLRNQIQNLENALADARRERDRAITDRLNDEARRG